MNINDYTDTIDKENLYKEYDSILNTTIVNLYSLSKNCDNIILNNFNYRSELNRVFLECAFVLNTLHGKKIGLNMPLIPFLYFKHVLLRKRKKNVFRVKDVSDKGINIEEVATFEVKAFNKTLMVFNDIYLDYYKHIYRKV